MKIAQIAPPWYLIPPTGYGGIELIVSQLADGLAENGHDVVLYASLDSTFKNFDGDALCLRKVSSSKFLKVGK